MSDRSRYLPAPAQRLSAGWSRRSVLSSGLAVGGVLLVAPGIQATPAQADTGASQRDIHVHRFTGWQFRRGATDGITVDHRGLRLASKVRGRRTYTELDGTTSNWEYGSWTSPVLSSGFDVTELIPSWNATTPGRSWVEIQVRVWADSGAVSDWFVMGRWCRLDRKQGGGIDRTSVDGQRTEVANVYTDTLSAPDEVAWSRVQLRVLLMRPVGERGGPSVSSAAAMCSNLPSDETVPVSTPGPARGRILDVPPYSQELHVGHYPEWDNGGEAWCSPTSTSMVADYWRHGPSAKDLSWVEPGPDRQVDYAARNTFDHTYDGCGNWPFNVAYAAGLGLQGYVTRLRSLAEAERFIVAGIPLVLSVSFKSEELDGAGYGTNGHLMVLRGFDADGNPVMNDPASHLKASNDQVRVTYRRDQFENVWVPHSGGTAYVMYAGNRIL